MVNARRVFSLGPAAHRGPASVATRAECSSPLSRWVGVLKFLGTLFSHLETLGRSLHRQDPFNVLYLTGKVLFLLATTSACRVLQPNVFVWHFMFLPKTSTKVALGVYGFHFNESSPCIPYSSLHTTPPWTTLGFVCPLEWEKGPSSCVEALEKLLSQ